jgi:hypothetical protein
MNDVYLSCSFLLTIFPNSPFKPNYIILPFHDKHNDVKHSWQWVVYEIPIEVYTCSVVKN